MKLKSYFLGANTPYGFFSLFKELYNPENDNTIYLIKGGPGTGKSSIMKKIASAAENKKLLVERIYCSSDPTSLDAIIIPELKTVFADATSPHIINPVYPGICEHTIDLSLYWNKHKLKDNSDIIKKISKNNSQAHIKCIQFLKAASVVTNELNLFLSNIYDTDKIKRYTNRLINTEIKNIQKGECRNIFLSALTPSGIVIHYDNIINYRKLIIKDKYGYVSELITKEINDYSELNNIKRINCLCPMNPENKTDHILFNNNFAILSHNNYHPIINDNYKTVNSDRFLIKDNYIKNKNKINFLNKTKTELINEAVNCLKEAKLLHDTLESYYISAMDFSKVSEITELLINEIL